MLLRERRLKQPPKEPPAPPRRKFGSLTQAWLVGKRGRKPRYRTRFDSISDLGTGLERPHPKPRRGMFMPKTGSKGQLSHVIAIKYNRRGCMVSFSLKTGLVAETEHFLFWQFRRAARALVDYFHRNPPGKSKFLRSMQEAAKRLEGK